MESPDSTSCRHHLCALWQKLLPGPRPGGEEFDHLVGVDVCHASPCPGNRQAYTKCGEIITQARIDWSLLKIWKRARTIIEGRCRW